jgi:hypothetical protein
VLQERKDAGELLGESMLGEPCSPGASAQAVARQASAHIRSRSKLAPPRWPAKCGEPLTGSIVSEVWDSRAQLPSRAALAGRDHQSARTHRHRDAVRRTRGHAQTFTDSPPPLSLHRMPFARPRSIKGHRSTRLHASSPRRAASTPVSRLRPHVLRPTRRRLLPPPAFMQHVRPVRRATGRGPLVRVARTIATRVPRNDHALACAGRQARSRVLRRARSDRVTLQLERDPGSKQPGAESMSPPSR